MAVSTQAILVLEDASVAFMGASVVFTHASAFAEVSATVRGVRMADDGEASLGVCQMLQPPRRPILKWHRRSNVSRRL